jgi:hypothetical protein
MKQLQVSEIIDEVVVCPYCMNEARGTSCCGESSAHFETAYVTQDETYLASEVEVTND